MRDILPNLDLQLLLGNKELEHDYQLPDSDNQQLVSGNLLTLASTHLLILPMLLQPVSFHTLLSTKHHIFFRLHPTFLLSHPNLSPSTLTKKLFHGQQLQTALLHLKRSFQQPFQARQQR